MDRGQILLLLDQQKAQFAWRLLSVLLIIIVYGYLFSVPVTGSGVGVTALW